MDTVGGTVGVGFEGVGEAFARVLGDQPETGASLAVWHGGRGVVDLWGGWADRAGGRRWERDTLVLTYSVGKPVAAVAVLLLVDRGLVELDAPVGRYWPEFAQAGKDRVTVRQLLAHQAGLIALRDPQPAEVLFDRPRLAALLAAEAPWWEPGTRHGEHALFYGNLLGEVVQRVTGDSLGTLLRAELAGPFGIDFHFGLTPAEQARTAVVTGLDDPDWRELVDPAQGVRALACGNPPGLLDPAVVNGARWRAAEVPAVNGHGTAAAVARFYALLLGGGRLDGARLLSAGTVAEMLRPQASGPDVFVGSDVTWGLGLQIEPADAGMGGLGGSLGLAHPDLGYAFGFATGRLRRRSTAADDLLDALHAALGAEPLP